MADTTPARRTEALASSPGYFTWHGPATERTLYLERHSHDVCAPAFSRCCSAHSFQHDWRHFCRLRRCPRGPQQPAGHLLQIALRDIPGTMTPLVLDAAGHVPRTRRPRPGGPGRRRSSPPAAHHRQRPREVGPSGPTEPAPTKSKPSTIPPNVRLLLLLSPLTRPDPGLDPITPRSARSRRLRPHHGSLSEPLQMAPTQRTVPLPRTRAYERGV